MVSRPHCVTVRAATAKTNSCRVPVFREASVPARRFLDVERGVRAEYAGLGIVSFSVPSGAISRHAGGTGVTAPDSRP